MLTTMWFIGLQFNKAEGLNVDLTFDIKAFMDIVYRQATTSNIFKEGMTIEAKYVRRKELSEYLPSDVVPLIKGRKSNSSVGAGGVPVTQLKEINAGHARSKTDPGPLLPTNKGKSPSPTLSGTGGVGGGRSRLNLPPPKNARAEPGPKLIGNEDVIPLSSSEKDSPHSKSSSVELDFASDSLDGAPDFGAVAKEKTAATTIKLGTNPIEEEAIIRDKPDAGGDALSTFAKQDNSTVKATADDATTPTKQTLKRDSSPPATSPVGKRAHSPTLVLGTEDLPHKRPKETGDQVWFSRWN